MRAPRAGPLEHGSIVRVRYLDHTFFREVTDSIQKKPRVMEAVGQFDYEDDESVCLIWEQYPEPNPSGNVRVHSTGLTVLKSTIIELKKIPGSG